jgi:hypothetical protein
LDLLKHDGEKIPLKLNRGGRTIAVELRLRALI